VVGPKIQIPEALDRAGVERYRLQIEQLLERLTCEAEAWAESGKRKVGQRPLLRQAKPLWSRRRPAEASAEGSAFPAFRVAQDDGIVHDAPIGRGSSARRKRCA
jgi:hypothetical protein